MTNYEGYINISLTDEKGFLLRPSEYSIGNDGLSKIDLNEKGNKTYNKGLIVKKGGNYKICVSDITYEKISGCTSITVYDKTTKEGAITMLNNYGITIHKSREEFKPNNTIRRDEAAKMIVSSLPYIKSNNTASSNKNCKFSDINNARSDLQRAVRESCKLGIFNGNNGLFKPQNTITNEQLLTVIGRILYGKQDESGESYSKPYRNRLNYDGYLNNLNIKDKDLNEPAKRGTLAMLLAKIM